MEVVGPVTAHIVSRRSVVITRAADSKLPPKRIVKRSAEGPLHKSRRVMSVPAHGQVYLCLVLQQDVAILVQNRVGQFAPVPLLPVFIIHIEVVNADGKAGVVRNALLPNGRGIGQDITGTVRKQVELGQLLSGLQREDRTQIVPYRRILRIADDGLTAAHRIGGQHIGDAHGVISHRDETPLLVTGQRDIFAVNGVGPAGLSPLL